MVAWSLIFGRT
jgi:hypothetical protein